MAPSALLLALRLLPLRRHGLEIREDETEFLVGHLAVRARHALRDVSPVGALVLAHRAQEVLIGPRADPDRGDVGGSWRRTAATGQFGSVAPSTAAATSW